MLLNFVVLLSAHWVADFVAQTHWQASNKSKSNVALFRHVTIYTALVGAASFVIFAPWMHMAGLNWLAFVSLNFVLHFATDWCSSRMTSQLFMEQFDIFDLAIGVGRNGGKKTDMRMVAKKDFNPHNFFVMIGLDQLIHQVTLASTMVLFFGK